MTTAKKNLFIELLISVFVFASLLLCIRFTNLDLTISDKANNITGFESTELLGAAAWIGKYLSVIVCSSFIIYMPFLIKKKSPLIREAVLAILILAIGPGIVNNFLLKPFFQRPRPVQIERYNENSDIKFVPALSKGEVKNHTSFPSGHSGAAFFFIFPWFCLRFRKKFGIRLIIPGLIFGLITGSIRILEGRHFASDVLASLTVVYLTGTVLSYFLYKETELANEKEETEQTV
ncbi:MAG: phosphatase PAP2 family protein [Lentisphaeraceae bacterium]|nr:phosphatase PAP2 family protein [Lentisphaeraceae bacterium]